MKKHRVIEVFLRWADGESTATWPAWLHMAHDAPDSTPHARHLELELRHPGERAATENVLLEWIRSPGKLLDPDTLFLAAKENCQDMGSSAYENNVSRLWRGGWKQNHSENSQMASTDCTVLAPSIFVLLFCISKFQPQWLGKIS